MVNQDPLKLRRGFRLMQGHDPLELVEKLEAQVVKGSAPNRDQWFKLARQSPLQTALFIRRWLKDDEQSRERSTRVHA